MKLINWKIIIDWKWIKYKITLTNKSSILNIKKHKFAIKKSDQNWKNQLTRTKIKKISLQYQKLKKKTR